MPCACCGQARGRSGRPPRRHSGGSRLGPRIAGAVNGPPGSRALGGPPDRTPWAGRRIAHLGRAAGSHALGGPPDRTPWAGRRIARLGRAAGVGSALPGNLAALSCAGKPRWKSPLILHHCPEQAETAVPPPIGQCNRLGFQSNVTRRTTPMISTATPSGKKLTNLLAHPVLRRLNGKRYTNSAHFAPDEVI